jgi:hypothetical protein
MLDTCLLGTLALSAHFMSAQHTAGLPTYFCSTAAIEASVFKRIRSEKIRMRKPLEAHDYQQFFCAAIRSNRRHAAFSPNVEWLPF